MAQVEYKPGKLQPDVAEAYELKGPVTEIVTRHPFRNKVNLAKLTKAEADKRVATGELNGVLIAKQAKAEKAPGTDKK